MAGNLRERLALAVERALPFSAPDDISYGRRKMIDRAADNVIADLLSFLSDNGLAIVPVKCPPLVRASMEDELTEQYAQSPQWEEAKDVVECWSAPLVYESAIGAAPPAAELLKLANGETA